MLYQIMHLILQFYFTAIHCNPKVCIKNVSQKAQKSVDESLCPMFPRVLSNIQLRLFNCFLFHVIIAKRIRAFLSDCRVLLEVQRCELAKLF